MQISSKYIPYCTTR